MWTGYQTYLIFLRHQSKFHHFDTVPPDFQDPSPKIIHSNFIISSWDLLNIRSSVRQNIGVPRLFQFEVLTLWQSNIALEIQQCKLVNQLWIAMFKEQIVKLPEGQSCIPHSIPPSIYEIHILITWRWHSSILIQINHMKSILTYINHMKSILIIWNPQI